jgi:hypothetical protein
MTDKPRVVQFLPWAGLKEEWIVGPVTFWPFATSAGTKVQDEGIRNHLSKYFACHVDQRGAPVKSVTVASNRAMDFREPTASEFKETRSACDAMIFSAIYPNAANAVKNKNGSMGPPSADRFQLITQYFTPGKEDIAIRAGSLMSGGWKLGEIRFSQPWCLGGFFKAVDKKTLTALSKVFDPGVNADANDRLFRSLEWFRLAHTELDEVSPLSKVVMMATAFEILLEVPNTPNKALWIAEKIEKQSRSDDSITETRELTLKRKKENVTLCKAAWWAWDFYKSRNAVVHGDDVKPTDLSFHAPDMDWLTHLIVADLLFGEFVIWELDGLKCMDKEVDEFIKSINVIADKDPKGLPRPQAVRFMHNLSDVHRALGWMKPLPKPKGFVGWGAP